MPEQENNQAKLNTTQVKPAETKTGTAKAAAAQIAQTAAAEAKAAKVKAAEAKAEKIKAAEAKAAKVKAAEVKAAEAKAAKVKAAEAKAAKVKAAEAKAAEAKAAEAKAAEAKAAKAKAAEAKAAEAKAAEAKAAEAKAAEAKAAEAKAAEAKAAEAKAAEAKAAEAKAAEAKAAEDKTVGTEPSDDLLVAAKETAGENSSLNIPALVNTFTAYAQPAYDTAWQYGSQLAAKMGLAADYNEHSTLVKGAIGLAGVAGAATGAFAAITTLAPISAPVIAFGTAAAAVGAINYQNGDNLVAHGFESIGEYCDTQFYSAATNASLFAGVPLAAAAFYKAGTHAQNALHSGSIATLKTTINSLKPAGGIVVPEADKHDFAIYKVVFEEAIKDVNDALAKLTDVHKDSSFVSNAATVVGNIAAATIHISLETLKGGAGAVIITGGLLALASAASSIYAYATDDLEQDDALMDLAQHRDTGYHREVSEMSSHDAQLQDLVLAGIHADGLLPA